MRRRWARRLGLLAMMLAITGVGVVWGFGSLMTRRTPADTPITPAGAQNVQLTSKDGIPLAANFWPGASDHAPGVLLLHGLGGSRSQFDGLGAALAAHGYAVLVIDFRAHGASGGDLRSFGLFEARDAHAAMSWLKAHQRGAKAGVVGLSLGGAAALLGEDGPVSSDALVLAAVYSDIHPAIRNRIGAMLGSGLARIGEPLLAMQAPWRFGVGADTISPINAIRRVHAPLLMIGGERDRYTPADETRAFFAVANAPKSIWLVPGADHNQVMATPEFQRRVIAFLDSNLR